MNENVVSYFEQFGPFNDLIKTISSTLGFDAYLLISVLIFLVACGVVVGAMATVGGLGTYAERKISADIQMRQGLIGLVLMGFFNF